MALIETIFRYRTLLGKCELGVGLDLDEAEDVMSIEAAFRATAAELRARGRTFRREAVRVGGLLRGDRIHDRVEVSEIGLGGFIVRKAPFIAKGELVELEIEIGDLALRFCARGVWLKEDGDDYRVGLAMVGMPVCLHRVALSAHTADVIDEISAAAA